MLVISSFQETKWITHNEKKKSMKILPLGQANFESSANQDINYFWYTTSQLPWRGHGYTWYAFLMLKNNPRQTLETDDSERISSSWCTFPPQHSVGSNDESVPFEFIDLCECSTRKPATDFFENQCQLWSCLLSAGFVFLSAINEKRETCNWNCELKVIKSEIFLPFVLGKARCNREGCFIWISLTYTLL